MSRPTGPGSAFREHGHQSSVGFAFAHLLGFQLLPRLQNIGSQRLYRPDDTDPGRWENLAPALTRPVRWDLIAQQRPWNPCMATT